MFSPGCCRECRRLLRIGYRQICWGERLEPLITPAEVCDQRSHGAAAGVGPEGVRGDRVRVAYGDPVAEAPARAGLRIGITSWRRLWGRAGAAVTYVRLDPTTGEVVAGVKTGKSRLADELELYDDRHSS